MQTDVRKPTNKWVNSEHMGKFVKVGEFNIHYYEAGEGAPLLLLHGIGQSLFTWYNCIDELSKHYHVYALDLVGYGYSDKPLETTYALDNIMEFINRFMEVVDLGKSHIIGVSTGALLALRLAEKYPYRVNRMSLISPGGITPEMPWMVRAMRSPLTSWLFNFFFSEKIVSSILGSCYFDQTHMTNYVLEEYNAPFATPNAVRVLIRSLQELDEIETMQELTNIQHEIQLIWGHEDTWHPVSIAEKFHLCLANSTVHTIRNCGHFPHEEKPNRFLEEVIPFLSASITLADNNSDMNLDTTAEDLPSTFGHLLDRHQ